MAKEYSYPDEFASKEEKLKKDWAYSYLRAAYSEMLAKESFNIDSLHDRFIASRKLAEGLRDIDDLKQRFSQNQDLSYLSINHAVSTPTPKILRIAARTIYNNSYKPTATPIDSASISKSGNKRNTIIHKMNMEKMRKNLEAAGVGGVIDKADTSLPKDEKELEIHMEMHPKIAEAIGWEYLIRQGFMQNKFEDIKQKVAKDLIDCKRGVTKVEFDRDNNLKIRYVDPVNFVTSFVNKDDHSDARHMGEIMSIPISQLREMIGDEYSEKDLQWIADNGQRSTGSGYLFGDKKYYRSVVDKESYNNRQVKVMNLQVLQYDQTTHIKKGKKNGGFRIEKKKNGYETPKHSKREKEVIHSGAQVIYEGYWVLNTDYIFGWRRKDEAFKERLNGKWFNTALFDYVVNSPNIYDMTNKSITETARYHDEQLFLLELKIQQHLVSAHPPGYVYNIDAILGAIEGMGLKNTEVSDMIKIKAQNGSMYVSSKNQDNELINGGGGIKPVEKLESGLDQTFILLLDSYDKRLNMLKEVVGVNDAVDGSQPDKKALVGIQKLAAEGHKAALSNENNAYQYIVRETAKRVYLGLQMQIKEGINIPELEASIGELNIKEIKLKSMSKADCSIEIEMLPDSFEIETINMDLQKMVDNNSISPGDKYTILRVAKESVKKAETMLSYLSKKFREELQANSEKNIQLQTQGNAEVAKMTAQMEAENIKLRLNLEGANESSKLEGEKGNNKEDWLAKSKFLILETEQKERLMRLDAELKGAAEEKKVDGEEKSEGKVGLDKSSITAVAGNVEPELGLNQVKEVKI